MSLKKYNELYNIINKLPRISLANLPTPLENANNLTKLLDGPNIYFKRDDLTGLPLAGNKTRMFEFSLAKVLNEKIDIVLSGASVQSNYCRQLVFACNKIGLKVFLVLLNLRGKKDHEIQGNLFLDLLGGSNVRIIKSNLKDLRKCLEKVKNELETKYNKKVHLMRGTDEDIALEGIGYVNCGLELYKQLLEKKLSINYIYACSSDTTQAGMLVANKYLGAGWKIVGITPSDKDMDTRSKIKSIANNISAMLKLGIEIKDEEVNNLSDYVGERYGISSKGSIEAIELIAKSESIVLDPIYTGKGMAGLLDHIKKGKFKKSENIIFLNTGGFPSIFAFSDEFDFSDRLTVCDEEYFIS